MTRFPLGFPDEAISEENRLVTHLKNFTTTSALPGTSLALNTALDNQTPEWVTHEGLKKHIDRIRKRIDELKKKWEG